MRAAVTVATVLLAAMLTGCTSQPAQPLMSTQGSTVVQSATVTNVRDVAVHGGRSSGLGGFAGSILGGVAGSRIGSGYGSTAAGIGGAIAGGMAGQHVEESGKNHSTTEVTVRFDSGETRTYHVESGASYRVGDTVKVTTSGGVSRLSPSY